MALNKKLKDELNAVKGLDSSSVYDEEDQKKAAQAKAQAKEKASTAKTASVGSGLKTGTQSTKTETKKTATASKKNDAKDDLARLRTELRDRLNTLRTDPSKLTSRAQDDETSTLRKQMLLNSMTNAKALMGMDRDDVYDVRERSRQLKGLASQMGTNALRAEGWAAEAADYGNTMLTDFYGGAKELLDRYAGQLGNAAEELFSPANRQKEAAKEQTTAENLHAAADEYFHGTGERQLTDAETANASKQNKALIAELEAKVAAGTADSTDMYLLEIYKGIQQKYDGEAVRYESPEQAAINYENAMQDYAQTSKNVNYFGDWQKSAQNRWRETAWLGEHQANAIETEKALVADPDYNFTQADYEAFLDEMLAEQNRAALAGFSTYAEDVRDQYNFYQARKYDYLRKTQGQAAADEYAKYIQPTVAERINSEHLAQMGLAPDSNGKVTDAPGWAESALGSVVFNPTKIANAIDVMIQTADRALTSSGQPVDYQTTGLGREMSNAYRDNAVGTLNEYGTLGDLIARLTDGKVNIGENTAFGRVISTMGLGDVLGAGIDMVNSRVNAIVFGPAGVGPAVFGESFADAYADAREADGTNMQSFWKAAGSAAAEGIGEQIVTSKYFEKLSELGKTPTLKGKFALGLLQMVDGYLQESSTTWMEQLADRIFMGENTQYDKMIYELMSYGYDPDYAAEIAQDALDDEIIKAGIMGLLGEGVGMAAPIAGSGVQSLADTRAGDRFVGSQIRELGNAESMAQKIGEITGKQVKTKANDRQLGKQYRKFMGTAGKYLKEADEATAAITWGKVNDVRNAPVKALDGTSQAAKQKATARAATMQTSDEGASVDGERVTVNGLTEVASKKGDAKITVTLADNSTKVVDIADITFDSKNAEVYSYAADMATPEVANAFRMSIQPNQMASIERVANGFDQAYDMAKAGFKEASVAASPLTKALTAEQVSAVYKLGAEARSAEQVKSITQATERAKANMGKVWRGGTARFDASVVVDALRDEQRRQVDLTSAITGAMGINVVFFESKADVEGRYTRENGSYNRKTNTIYIDVNAGINRKGESMTQIALLRTLSHEVTHAIQRNSPETYKQLREIVVDVLSEGKNITLDDLIAAKMAKDESLTTRDAAIDELVADACERMLDDTDAAQKLIEAHPEAAKTFFQKVSELLGKIKEAIKAAFKGRPLTGEAQIVMQDIERYEQLKQLFEKGVMETAEVSGREYADTEESAETEALEDENTAISEDMTAESEEVTSEELVGPFDEPARPAEAHIDNRTWESVGDRSVKAFQNDYKAARDYMGPAAKALLADANASLPGERYRTADGEWGGQQRQTTEVLAELKDRGGWSWDQLKNALGVIADRYDAGDLQMDIPDTAIIKRIEIVLDEILTEGYDAMEGAHIVPNAGYIAYKAELPGAAKHDVPTQEDGLTFDEYTQFQTREVDGKKVVWIENNILEQKPKDMKYTEYVAEYLKQHIREVYRIIESGQKVYLGEDLPGEYTESRYTKRIRNKRQEVFYAKNRTATGLGEAIEIATNRRWEKTKHPDNKDAKYGIYKYSTAIAFPMYDSGGSITQVHAYTADLLIRNASDGKKYLYDVVNIKNDAIKAGSLLKRETARHAKNAAKLKGIIDKGIIPQPASDFNTEIQKQTRDEAISTRFVLANMLEADASSSEEVAWLRGYKGQLYELEMVMDAIEGNKQTVRELMSKKGRTAEETERLTKARNRMKVLQDQVARMDEGLLNLENSDLIRTLVDREVRKLRDKEAEKRREGIAKVREKQRNTAIRKNIQRRAKRLDRMLRRPTDKDHIPDGLKDAILELMQIFVGEGRSHSFGGAKDDVLRAYRAQQEYDAIRGDDKNPDLASRFDEDTAERLKELAKLMDSKPIAKFDNAQLTLLSMIIEHFEHLVRDQNEAFTDSKRRRTETYAEQVWQQTMTMKGRKENAITASALVKAIKQLGRANVIPPYFYKHLGGAMGKLGNDMLKGESRWGVNMKKAEERIAKIKAEYDHAKWAYKPNDILVLETEIGDKLELTREQALGIWASAKRERLNTMQRAAHLRDGGVILEKPARKLGMKGQEINVTPTKMSPRDIAKIDKWLTDQQKKYADAMVAYISNDMAELGNETSMELVGYRKFGEGYYYPYKTSSDFRRTELGKVEQALIRNMGFTKTVTPNAKTPVVITDFSATVSDHINNMIMYNAFAVAQDQLMRVFDFKLDDSNSVKNLLRNAFGEEIPKYIEQHMRDIYGGVTQDRDAGLVSGLISAHKKQSVLASASVVIQQPWAMTRAMALINPKYFIGARVKGGYEEAMKYAGTAVIKKIGGFDSGTTRGASDWLNGNPQDWARLPVKSALDTVSDYAGKGAEYADQIAWTAIWKAVKREQAEKYKLDITSEELLDLAGERFDEVTRLTQVYDSVMTRSQLMRNKNIFWKGATSFMSEPTVTLNMMIDAGIEIVKNKNFGKGMRILGAVLVSTILTNLAKAFVTAARDDDDEEATYWERYAKNAAEGLVNDVVPFNYVPVVRDIYSMLQGFEVKRADMSIVNDIIAAGAVMLDEDKAPVAKVKSLVQLMSILTGLPGKNIWRDVEAVFNTAAAVPQSEAREGWLENALRTGVVDATPIGKWFDLTDTKKRSTDMLYASILAGDSAAEDDLREHLIIYNGVEDDKAVNSLLRTRIKDGFLDGEISEDEALKLLTGHAGMSKDDAEKRIGEWSYALENDGNAYGDLKERFLAGEITAEDAVQARVEYGGAEQKAAQTTVKKWEYERDNGYSYDDLREEHAEGNVSDSEAIKAMTEYGGKDANDAYWTIAEWNYGDDWDGKGTLLNDAFAAGNSSAVRSRMQELAQHSDWKKPGNELASYVSDYYKPIFEAASTERKRQLQPIILGYIKLAYEAVGEEYYGDKNSLRYRSWLKIE